MISRVLCLTAAIVLFTPVAGAGAQAVDQSNYNGTLNFNNVAHGYSPFASTLGGSGQTFKTPQNTSAGAGLYLANIGALQAVGTLNVSLWTAAPVFGGTFLASGSVDYSLAPNAEAMFDAFWSPVSLTLGFTNQYFLSFASDLNVTATTSNADVTAYYANDPYFNGVAWADIDGAGPGNTYHPFTVLDLRFEEFYVAPEPASLVLMATGLAVLGLASRRRERR